ncbi:LamG-like jellyroll fold domain-containing protein [Wenyingzhuangia sp. chi5]|uniref:LamG-like jellyroll fold domain-containing protein n=1 Tax=Wenyingzhuangia gilva TaxID=3057677 RepID=A0ABT8VT80_9FLAO|nr:LamG-like jellyroll fold domain-containing protein [Wenyingzhuangia sp. chi5]MDO3695168.1 LamG-like jellyroll fold domain-containing protein [Wenyingzhuangia sp. chi5]
MFVLFISFGNLKAQTLAFPEATGFGKYTTGARGYANPEIYLVTNLNDSGAGSFRDAVSQPGRFVIFRVGGIINLQSQIVVAKNTTIAGQTATGEGIVLYGPRVTFTGASNTIARYIRIRFGGAAKNQDASGLSNGENMIFDHMTFSWGTDEVFSINWDGKGTSPDNITVQNSIIGQGLHRHNHSAGGLIQPSGGKISLIGNLYTGNKTRNPKVKGINEFVNNVVYNWGNYGNTYGHTESGEAYIMGGDSDGVSNVNIINNYFIGGPNTSTTRTTPFSRGNSNFYLYGSGNYFDNDRDGTLNGSLVSADTDGYPTGDSSTILNTPYDYPMKNPTLTAEQTFNQVVLNVGASYPKRDQVDSLMIDDLKSKGLKAFYVYRETDLPFINGGVGHVYAAPAPLDSDNDGMPDDWEDANGLNKNDNSDALAVSSSNAPYLNIEVYINGLVNTTPPDFITPPSSISFSNQTSTETPPNSTLTVQWSDNADNEESYILERSTNGTDFTVIATLNANITSYNEVALVPNTKYYYRVKATNSSGSSVYSNVSSVTTPQIPTAPSKTAIVSPSMGYDYVELSDGKATLKWTGSDNTSTFAIYFGTEENNLTKLSDVTYSGNPLYEVINLSSNVNYYWRIDATNDKGTTEGDVWNFKTIANIQEEMVGYWPFNEAVFDGGDLDDKTSYNNVGVLDVNYDNTDVRVTGKAGNALDFSTSPNDTYMVNIPNKDQIFLNNSSFTISIWVKAAFELMPTGSNSAYLLCKGSFKANETTGATGKRYNIEFKDSQFRFAIDDNVVKKELSTSATPFFTGDWENIVVMRDVINHKLKLYINGVFSNEIDETGVTGIAEVSDLILGNIGEYELLVGTGSAPYKGMIDELKIFNYALNETEVLELYQNVLLSNKNIIKNSSKVKIYPNPAKEQININIPLYNKNRVTAILKDIAGKVVFKQELIAKSQHQFIMQRSNKIKSGIYVLHIIGDDLNNTLKVIIE